MATLHITYLGWSGFRLEAGGEAVTIDAFWGGLQRRVPRMPRDWARDLDAVVVTHGHYDHCASTPELLRRNPEAALVADPAMTSFARRQQGVAAGRCHGGAWGGRQLQVELLRAAHFVERPSRTLPRALRWGAKDPASLLRLLRQRRSTPADAPMHVVRARGAGQTILHAGEVFHSGTSFRQVRQWLGGQPLDVLLAGVEPGQETAVVRGVDALRPRRVLLFSPHRWTRQWFDRADPLDLGSLAARLSALPWGPDASEVRPDRGAA